MASRNVPVDGREVPRHARKSSLCVLALVFQKRGCPKHGPCRKERSLRTGERSSGMLASMLARPACVSSLLCFNSEDAQNMAHAARNVPCRRERGARAWSQDQHVCPRSCVSTARMPKTWPMPQGTFLADGREVLGHARKTSMCVLALVFQQRGCPKHGPCRKERSQS